MGEAITAGCSAVALVGALCVWAVRQIVRAELDPIRQDIAVLRGAVFNHLAHGETPDEPTIRERLGYGKRV